MSYFLNTKGTVLESELPADMSAYDKSRWLKVSRRMTNGTLIGPKPVKIIIIDFDGTVCEDSYPEVGSMLPNADTVINRWYNAGHMILIDTCRVGLYQHQAEVALRNWGIPYHYINSNLPEQIALYGSDCRKLSGHLRIDNIQLGGIPDWLEIERMAGL